MEYLEDIKAKLQKLEEYEQKRKQHMETCKKYQRERIKTDEEFRKKQYELSREYQRRRYNEDPEFRNAKLLRMKARYEERKKEKKESLGGDNLEIQKNEKSENEQK